jgi:hypothetical protein
MRYVLLALVVLAAYFGIAALVLRLRDSWRGRRVPPVAAELRFGTREYSDRLRYPHLSQLERALSRHVSESFKELYSKADLLGQSEVVFIPPHASSIDQTWPVSHFLPADALALQEHWPGILNQMVGFAVDPFGDLYVVPTFTTPASDGPVSLIHHDGGDHSPVAGSLREFLSWDVLTEREASRRFSP